MKYIFTLALFFISLPFMSSTYAQDCCDEPKVTATPTADCEGIELCISGYEGCEDTWFKFHAYSIKNFDGSGGINYNNGGEFTADNCYTFTGLNLDHRFNLTVSVALPDECGGDLLQRYRLEFMDFSDCVPVDCCTTTPTATATPTADCEGVELCISGYEGCEDTWFKFSVEDQDTNQNYYSGSFSEEGCYTFTGLDLNHTFNFVITIALADECGNPMDLLVHLCLNDMDFSDCVPTIDPCCVPPNIEDVEFNSVLGFNEFEICLPESPCPDQEGLLYGIRSIEICGGEPGFYSINSSHTNCISFRYREGCQYRFQAGYYSYDCLPVEWSEEYIFNARLAGKIGINNPLSLTNSTSLVYPNPFKEAFQIQFSVEEATAYQLSIYDLQGQLVLTLDGQSMTGENHITIDELNAMPSGNYYYQLATDDQHFSNKIVKY